MYKTLIIDDERLAREEVKRALESYSEFEVLGEANNVDNAKYLIERTNPDIIFLDIHMPKKSGFDLLDELVTVPEVIFTTAYNQYAVQAFEVNALDYLVKPIREERFSKTIEKIKKGFKKKERDEPFLLHRKIFIKDGQHCYFIPISSISLIESVENYARIHFDGQHVMIKRSLNHLQEKLDPSLFFRVNRSQIINTEYISEIHPHFNNKLKITLSTGEVLEVSSRQSAKFKKWNSI